MLVIFFDLQFEFEIQFFYLQCNFHNELPLKNEHPPIEKQPDLIHLLEFEK